MRRKQKYTLKLHVHRLETMLLTGKPLVHRCPAKLGFVFNNYDLPSIIDTWANNPCVVCRDFVACPDKICPCMFIRDVLQANPRAESWRAIIQYRRKAKLSAHKQRRLSLS